MKNNKLIILLSLLTIAISGCTGTHERLKEPTFTQGCASVKAGIRLGYLNQEGMAEACKIKCSETLPENYCYEYTNQQAGCKVKVGNCE